MTVDQPTPVPSPTPSSNGVPRWVIATLLGGAVVIVALLAVVIVLLMGGDGDSSGGTATDTSSKEAKTFDADGDLTLISADNELTGGGGCIGGGGYDDISSGTQVVIRDSSGTTVAVDHLLPGTKSDSYVTCVFDFTVHDVPSGHGPYSVEVSHRGEISFNEADAGNLHLTLG
jgi:hypothetical protein